MTTGAQPTPNYRSTRLTLAAVYFFAPTLIIMLCALCWESARLPDTPAWYAWRFLFCVLTGFCGIAVRLFHLRKEFERSPVWPEYFTTFPLSVVMNASAVFTLLSLPTQLRNILFFTGAAPLCLILGVYCHPDHWILTQFIKSKLPEWKP